MGQIRLGIGQVNITNYLIGVARKTTTPLTIEAQEAYAPPHPTTRNVVIPAVGDIDPVIYYVDFYESSDGVALDLLLSQFVYDLKNQVIISERRFYKVGGGFPTDPDPDQQILEDAYLDGKTISGVFKEGFRYLRPDTEPVPEYLPHTGGGIELQGDLQFSQDETYVIEISYLADQSAGGGASGLYSGVELIDTTMTLNSSYRNKRLRTEASSTVTLVVTMESLASVPDGTFYHFTSNGGTQNQTRILPSGSETIRYNGEDYTEMSLGKGEFLRIVKTGSFWEAEMAHHNILQVGEKVSATWKDHPSTKPEDGTLYDGDEWPRPWWWIKNKLPSTHYIIDDNVINGGYTHPTDKLGLFVIHSTQKKFRMPNTQNISERALKNFTSYGGDAQRLYDYPGGIQTESIGPGKVRTVSFTGQGILKNAVNDNPGFLATLGDGGVVASDSASGTNNNSRRTDEWDIVSPTGETRVKNEGVIYLRRF
jgi:hypothetical protein